MSEIQFLYEKTNKSIKDGKKIIHEESIVSGDKGLIIKYFHKEDENVEKITIRQENGKFKIVRMSDGKSEEEILAKNDLIDRLTKIKYLKFALDYLKEMKGGQGRQRRSSKKSRDSSGSRKRKSKRQSRSRKSSGSSGSRKSKRKSSGRSSRSRRTSGKSSRERKTKRS